jgi:DNA repair protein RadD
MQLRDYQERIINAIYKWFGDNPEGNPVAVAPTGSGKSHLIAAFVYGALTQYPDTRVLMLTHVKELIEQNSEKMRQHWPGAPMGIYSASVGKRQLGEPITFGGVQSLRKRARQLGHIDLILVDECHLISHKDEGSYRSLIGELRAINPHLRVIGFTATPWRLGHGVITGEGTLFSALIECVTIEELIYKGHLAPLRSKSTAYQLDVSKVAKRGGDYIEKDLQDAVNTQDANARIADEIVARAGDRKHWLLFCAGVAHAEAMAAELIRRGISAACLTGAATKGEREKILAAYKAGEIQALTNVNVLTTGFDFTDIDLLACIRPTMSPTLYVQMVGRGMRPKSHTDHCLVLDFAGLVRTHGPVTAVQPPKKRGAKEGDAPVKVCDECDELVHISAKVCPSCGFVFPIPKKEENTTPYSDDIMGIDPVEMPCTSWRWRVHTSRNSGMKMLMVSYYGGYSDPIVSEYLTVLHGGYAEQKALRTLAHIVTMCGATLPDISEETLDEVVEALQASKPPTMIAYKADGKFYRVLQRSWDVRETAVAPVAQRTPRRSDFVAPDDLPHLRALLDKYGV